ncbi:hypothetical protein GGI22_004563 [Coemansia erecta]|nr:hypothetical protein GGI22_004563 [Coemansia erecta]
MEVQLEPLLKYAEELMQSYSRIIVYSGDILQSLPEPREGLSTANIKPKKEESIAFLREWKHLESVFDEFLIRLNDIRTRAHEELEAARVKCLVGEDIDLMLPEAVFKLKVRLIQYKRQYAGLLKVLGGGLVDDIIEPAESPARTDVDMEDKEATAQSGNEPLGTGDTRTSPSAAQQPSLANPVLDSRNTDDTKATTAQTAETPGVMAVDDNDNDEVIVKIESPEEENGSSVSKPNEITAANAKSGNTTSMEVGTPMSVLSELRTSGTPAANVTENEAMDVSDSPAPATGAGQAAAPVSVDVDADSLFDAHSNAENEAIGIDSNSDLDNEEMEDIFQ